MTSRYDRYNGMTRDQIEDSCRDKINKRIKADQTRFQRENNEYKKQISHMKFTLGEMILEIIHNVWQLDRLQPPRSSLELSQKQIDEYVIEHTEHILSRIGTSV